LRFRLQERLARGRGRAALLPYSKSGGCKVATRRYVASAKPRTRGAFAFLGTQRTRTLDY